MIKNIPLAAYEKNETLKAFYDCLGEDISHYDELLSAAVDSITREVSLEKGEILKSRVQSNTEGIIETGIKLFIKTSLTLKTLIGFDKEKSKENTESKTRTVMYRKPDDQGLIDIINDFIHGYSLLRGEERLLLYIDDLDRISSDPQENERKISELIYYLKDLSSHNPNLLVFASIGESFYNLNKEKFFRRISLLEPMEDKDLLELYKRRCEVFAVDFLSMTTAGQLAELFKGFPGRFLDALDKLYIERGKIRFTNINDIYAYCRREIEQLENGARAEIPRLKQILDSKVKDGTFRVTPGEFKDIDLARTPLVGEILWEIPYEPGIYRINPLYGEALKKTAASRQKKPK